MEVHSTVGRGLKLRTDDVYGGSRLLSKHFCLQPFFPKD